MGGADDETSAIMIVPNDTFARSKAGLDGHSSAEMLKLSGKPIKSLSEHSLVN
jgi:hypothetical protein